MGYAFDSTSNFNATWSNSYASAVLAPGNAVAAGFARAADKRYFEFVVNSNTDVGYLWLGVLWRLGTSQNGWLIGGGSEVGTTAGGVIGGKSAGLTSVTAEAGDVFGFAVNYSTDGIGGLSSVTYAGAGIIEISKNGVFTGHRAVFPASGPYVAGARPLVIQEAGTSTSAVVTLRVDSLSYSYMPTGYSEWGSSGGVTVVGPQTLSWGWDANKIVNSGWTLSGTTAGSNIVMKQAQTITASTAGSPHVLSLAIPFGQKVAFEILEDFTTTYSINYQYIGFVRDEHYTGRLPGGASNTETGIFPTGYIGAATIQYAELTTTSGGQMNPVGAANIVANGPKWKGFLYDDQRGIVAGYGAAHTYSTSAGELWPSIETCRPIFSITASTTMRFYCKLQDSATRAPQPAMRNVLNDGRFRLRFPLYPGWFSLNRQRYVSVGGESWYRTWDDPGKVETSFTASCTIVNDIVAYINNGGSGGMRCVRSTGGHSSGKKYFEILLPANQIVLNNAYLTGVATHTITFSGTQGSRGTLIGMRWDNASYYAINRFGTTAGTTITAGVLTGSLTVAGEYWRFVCAADIDAGNLWFGYVKNNATIEWIGGGDPAAGTLPTATFTASHTLYTVFGSYNSGSNTANKYCWAAWEDGALRFDPPTGFTAWYVGTPPTTTTTATVTPSFTGSSTSSSTASSTSTNAPGGGGGRKWPFGFRP